MEREIANVAASCAMRGFRYMAFPPIVFDAPPIQFVPTPELVLAVAPPAAVMRPEEMGLDAALPSSATVLPERPARQQTPEPAHRAAAASVTAPVTDRAAAEPTEVELAAPALPPSPRERRFALLAEVSAQLNRQAPP